MRSVIPYLPALVVASLICGCGGDDRTGAPEKYSVEGTVRFEDGEPVAGAIVSFSSLDGTAEAAATTSDDGHYQIGGDGGGLPAGDYRVVIHPPLDETGMPLESSLDPKYSQKETSGLTETIKPMDNHCDIEVKRAE